MYLPHVFPQSLDCETSIHVILYRALSRDVTTLTSNQKLGAGVLTFHVGHKWNVWLMANFFILHVYIISEGLIMFVCALSARLVLVPLGLAMIKSIYVTAGYITML